MQSFVKLIRWFVFWPMLIFMSFAGFMTGLPYWVETGESLNSPSKVRSVEENALVLIDGKRLPIPHVTKIPHTLPLIKAAVADGVEVKPNGDVIGLLWARPFCGNAGISRYRSRVNLTDLIASIEPELITPQFEMEEIENLKDSRLNRESHEPQQVGSFSLMQLKKWGEVIRDHLKLVEPAPDQFSEAFEAALSRRLLANSAMDQIQLVLAFFGVVAALSIRERLLGPCIILLSGLWSAVAASFLLSEWWDGLNRSVTTVWDESWVVNHDGGLMLVGIEIVLKAAFGVAVAFGVRWAVGKVLHADEVQQQTAAS